MSVWSAFDAYAKSDIFEALFGKGQNSKYDFDNIFTAQVEAHNRDWAKDHGLRVFTFYRECGALNNLMLELNQSLGTPKFEFEIRGTLEVKSRKVNTNVVLLGKPDVFYINSENAHVL